MENLFKKIRFWIALVHLALSFYLLLFIPYFDSSHPPPWVLWLHQNKILFIGSASFYALLAVLLFFFSSNILLWAVFFLDSAISIFAVAAADPIFFPFLLGPGMIAGLIRRVPYFPALLVGLTVQLMALLSLLLKSLFQKQTTIENFPLWQFGFALLLVNAIAMLTAYVTSRALKEQRRAEALLDLMKVSHEMGAIHNYDKISGLLSTIISSMFNVHSFGLYVIEEQKEGEKMAVPRWIESPHAQTFLPFALGVEDSIMAEALRSRKPQVVYDLRQSKDRVLPQLQIFRGGLFHPVLFEDEALGLVFLISNFPGAYGSEEASLLELLSAQVAVTLKNISLYQKTATMAITDSLTDLYTHGYFQDQLMKLVIEYKYSEKPLGLLILDVDHFKVINDTYGHPQGDYILRQLAGLVKSLVRTEDVVSRYGGDEFVLILPGLDRVRSTAIAERLRAAVEEYSFVAGGKTVSILVSIGVSSFPEKLTTKDLILSADEALYEAKKRGRNQIYYV